jgi:hypothetical protein
MLSRNFRDVLSELSAAQADFLVVGAHAMAAHALPRATGDLDVWVRPDADNAQRVWAALARFGAPLVDYGISVEELARPGLVFQIGNEPDRVDILTAIDSVEFEEAWQDRVIREIDGISVPVLGLTQLLKNKRATGRPKDRFDVAWIEEEYGIE